VPWATAWSTIASPDSTSGNTDQIALPFVLNGLGLYMFWDALVLVR